MVALGVAGGTPSVLAESAQMTKQSMADPSDRRPKLFRATPRELLEELNAAL